jgi:hypothetical protein
MQHNSSARPFVAVVAEWNSQNIVQALDVVVVAKGHGQLVAVVTVVGYHSH